MSFPYEKTLATNKHKMSTKHSDTDLPFVFNLEFFKKLKNVAY